MEIFFKTITRLTPEIVAVISQSETLKRRVIEVEGFEVFPNKTKWDYFVLSGSLGYINENLERRSQEEVYKEIENDPDYFAYRDRFNAEGWHSVHDALIPLDRVPLNIRSYCQQELNKINSFMLNANPGEEEIIFGMKCQCLLKND